MVRKPIIAGNWKMHKTATEARQFICTLLPLIEDFSARVFLAPSFTALHAASVAAKGSSIVIGAQNMSEAEEGALTGEVSSRMLKEAGAHFVLVGHSERRQMFHESNRSINCKVKRALAEGLLPILCIGETLEEREGGKTCDVLSKQLEEGLSEISTEGANLALAYEPVWAIGTGMAATAPMAQETHFFIREWCAHHWGKAKAESLSLLYGGSVKPETIEELIEQKDIDGALVGGASLDASVFAQIINRVHLRGMQG